MFQVWIPTTYGRQVQLQQLYMQLLHVKKKKKKTGHLTKACVKKKKERGNNTTHQVTTSPRYNCAGSDVSEDEGNTDNPFIHGKYEIFWKCYNNPYEFTVTVEDKGIPREIDTGSSVTLLSSSDFLNWVVKLIHSNLLQ